jgi:peptidoglycan/LPS O-acetylase OafA/YrhL
LWRFRRITSSGTFIPEIDGLRFVAVASVVLYHLHGFLPIDGMHIPFLAAIGHGYRGVNLFYVISGFVLGMPFARHSLRSAPRVNLRAYFIRRLTRLEPPYILNLLICFALVVAAQGASLRSQLPHLGASILYLHNLVYGEQSTINAVAWTLEIEVQFYCLMPVFALLFPVRSKAVRRAVLTALILVAGMIQVLFWDGPPRAKLSILYAVQFFVAGLLLADIYVEDWRERPESNWRWDLVSCACWPVLFLMPDREGWVFFPFLILLVYVSAFRGVLFRSIFRNSFVTAVGGMCYTIYLMHYQLIQLVVRKAPPAGAGGRVLAVAIEALLYLFALAVVSCVYFLAIERPCMKKDWPRRLAHRVAHLFRTQAASAT